VVIMLVSGATASASRSGRLFSPSKDQDKKSPCIFEVALDARKPFGLPQSCIELGLIRKHFIGAKQAKANPFDQRSA